MKPPDSKLRRLWLGGTFFTAVLAAWYAFAPAPGIRQINLDVRYARSNRLTPASPRVVIVDIDDPTLDPARTVEELRRRLAPAGPAVVLFEETSAPLTWKSPPEGLKVEPEPRNGTPSRLMALLRYRDGRWYPSRALSAVMATLKNPRAAYEKGHLTLEGDAGERYRVPVDAGGRFLPHFYRPDREPRVVSFRAVLGPEANLAPEAFRNRIVLVGARGWEGRRVTHIWRSLSESLIDATAVSNILLGDYLRNVPPWLQLLVIVLVMWGQYAMILFLKSLRLKILFPLALVLGYLTAQAVCFRHFNLNLDTLGLGFLTLIAMIHGFLYLVEREMTEKRRLRAALLKYVAPAVAEELIARGTDPRAEVGREEEVTVLFADIRGFTGFAESAEAREVVARLNAYLEEMTAITFRHQGTLDKFLGDGMMVFWGAPLPDPRHPLKAVLCALDMQRRLEERRRGLGEIFQMGVAVHTGRAVVGNVGSEVRLDYTVIGDSVNLTSRLNGLSKEVGAPIVIGPRTREGVEEEILCRPLGRLGVRGRQEPVEVFEPLCRRGDPEASDWESCLEDFSRIVRTAERGAPGEAAQRMRAWLRARPRRDAVAESLIQRWERGAEARTAA